MDLIKKEKAVLEIEEFLKPLRMKFAELVGENQSWENFDNTWKEKAHFLNEGQKKALFVLPVNRNKEIKRNEKEQENIIHRIVELEKKRDQLLSEKNKNSLKKEPQYISIQKEVNRLKKKYRNKTNNYIFYLVAEKRGKSVEAIQRSFNYKGKKIITK